MLSIKPSYFEFPVFQGSTSAIETRAGLFEMDLRWRIHRFFLAIKPKNEHKLSDPSIDLSEASELSNDRHFHLHVTPLFLLGQSKSVPFYSPVPNEESDVLNDATGAKTEKSKSVTSTDEEQSIPNTTEYLDGMTHSDSPPGLLPRFSSWSLCCIGRTSDYVPTKGNDRLKILSEMKEFDD